MKLSQLDFTFTSGFRDKLELTRNLQVEPYRACSASRIGATP